MLKKSTFESVHNIEQVIEGLVKAVCMISLPSEVDGHASASDAMSSTLRMSRTR